MRYKNIYNYRILVFNVNVLPNEMWEFFYCLQKERKTLMNKRLDLDACKNRLRKAKSLENQANVSDQQMLVMLVTIA